MQKDLENCEEVLNFFISPKNNYWLLSREEKPRVLNEEELKIHSNS